MVGLEGRENVRSTLEFLDSDGPLGDAVGKDGRGQRSEKNVRTVAALCEADLPALVSEKLLVLKMSGSKLRLPLLLRRAEDVRLLGDSALRGSAEPTQTVNCCTQAATHRCAIVK